MIWVAEDRGLRTCSDNKIHNSGPLRKLTSYVPDQVMKLFFLLLLAGRFKVVSRATYSQTPAYRLVVGLICPLRYRTWSLLSPTLYTPALLSETQSQISKQTIDRNDTNHDANRGLQSIGGIVIILQHSPAINLTLIGKITLISTRTTGTDVTSTLVSRPVNSLTIIPRKT